MIVRVVRRKLCDITLDFGTEQKSTAESSDEEETYELPDGNFTQWLPSQWPRFRFHLQRWSGSGLTCVMQRHFSTVQVVVPIPAHFSSLLFLWWEPFCACAMSAHDNFCTDLTYFHSASKSQNEEFLRSAVLVRFPCGQNKDSVQKFCDVFFPDVDKDPSFYGSRARELLICMSS